MAILARNLYILLFLDASDLLLARDHWTGISLNLHKIFQSSHQQIWILSGYFCKNIRLKIGKTLGYKAIVQNPLKSLESLKMHNLTLHWIQKV